MWWAGNSVHDAYLGTRALAVCQRSQVLLAQATSGLDDSLRVLSGWLAGQEDQVRLKLWLSGGLCRPFLLPAGVALKDDGEWQRLAESIAALQSGFSEVGRVWVERRNKAQRRVATALAKGLPEAIQGAVAALKGGHRIDQIAPWWGEVLRAALHQATEASALAIQDDDSLVLLVGEASEFATVSTVTPVYGEQAALAAMQRASFSAGLSSERWVTARLMLQGPTAPRHDMALAALTSWSP